MKVSTDMLSVYDGQVCVGWVIRRGPRGYESFDAREQSLGLFASRDAAIDRCIKQNDLVGWHSDEVCEKVDRLRKQSTGAKVTPTDLADQGGRS
jgi:hypothetical protein